MQSGPHTGGGAETNRGLCAPRRVSSILFGAVIGMRVKSTVVLPRWWDGTSGDLGWVAVPRGPPWPSWAPCRTTRQLGGLCSKIPTDA